MCRTTENGSNWHLIFPPSPPLTELHLNNLDSGAHTPRDKCVLEKGAGSLLRWEKMTHIHCQTHIQLVTDTKSFLPLSGAFIFIAFPVEHLSRRRLSGHQHLETWSFLCWLIWMLIHWFSLNYEKYLNCRPKINVDNKTQQRVSHELRDETCNGPADPPQDMSVCHKGMKTASRGRYDGRRGRMLCKETESQQGVRSLIVITWWWLFGGQSHLTWTSQSSSGAFIWKCNQTLCHSLCSLTSSPSRITLYLHDLCHHLNVTVSTPGPPSVTVLCSSVCLSVSSVSCLVLLFLRIRCLHDYLPACPSVRPAEPADDLLLHWNHLTLFFCLLSGPVLFVEWESQTQVRGSPHFIRFILRGTWLSERLSRSVDQWQLPHFNNGK